MAHSEEELNLAAVAAELYAERDMRERLEARVAALEAGRVLNRPVQALVVVADATPVVCAWSVPGEADKFVPAFESREARTERLEREYETDPEKRAAVERFIKSVGATATFDEARRTLMSDAMYAPVGAPLSHWLELGWRVVWPGVSGDGDVRMLLEHDLKEG